MCSLRRERPFHSLFNDAQGTRPNGVCVDDLLGWRNYCWVLNMADRMDLARLSLSCFRRNVDRKVASISVVDCMGFASRNIL